MNIINNKDLSEESTRKLIAEYQDINQKIAALELEIKKRKEDLTFNDNYELELRSLERKSSRIKADLIIGHKQMMGKAVGYCLKKYGIWDHEKGRKVPPLDLNGFRYEVDKNRNRVEVDDDELKTLALIQFQKTLHNYDLNKDYAGVKTFSEKAWRDIKTFIKNQFGIAGMKQGEARKAIWAEQCLQKLVNVRKNECLRQRREVTFYEVSKILNIDYKIVRQLVSICRSTEPIHIADDKGGGVKTDYFEDCNLDDCRINVEDSTKNDWLNDNINIICTKKEVDVLANRLFQPQWYTSRLTSIREEFPIEDNRIKEIEDLLNQNITDERLIDRLMEVFEFEPRSTEPDVELLIRLGIYKN